MKMKKWLKCLRMTLALVLVMSVGVVSTTIPVAAKAKTETVKVGGKFQKGKFQYKVTSLNGTTGTSALVGVKSKNVTSVNVPATVKKGKYTLTVTAIGDNAFKNCKKLKSVVTNTTLQKIGKNAFAGCKKLAKIDIRSGELGSVGKNALKGISKKAVVKVPQGTEDAYAKKLHVTVQAAEAKAAPKAEPQAKAPVTAGAAAQTKAAAQAKAPEAEEAEPEPETTPEKQPEAKAEPETTPEKQQEAKAEPEATPEKQEEVQPEPEAKAEPEKAEEAAAETQKAEPETTPEVRTAPETKAPAAKKAEVKAPAAPKAELEKQEEAVQAEPKTEPKKQEEAAPAEPKAEPEKKACEAGHNYTWETTAEPTCTQTGTEEGTCTVCGAKTWHTIAAKEHSYGEWTIVPLSGSNCYGRNERTCTVCGHVEKSSYAVHRTDVLENLEDIAPTCTEAGKTNRTYCPYCHAENFRYVKPLGHDYSSEVTVEAGNCVKAEVSYRKCTRCDAKTDVKEIKKAMGHDWQPLTISATCTETGFVGNECTLCHEREGKVTAPTGHKYVTTIVKATCEKAGSEKATCSVCGETTEKILPANGEHRWVTYPKKEATCVEAGHSEYTECSVCGEYKGAEPVTYAATGEHQWVALNSASVPYAVKNGVALTSAAENGGVSEADGINDADDELTSFTKCCKHCGCYTVQPGKGLENGLKESENGGTIAWIVFLADGEWSDVCDSNYCSRVCMNGKTYACYLVAVRNSSNFMDTVKKLAPKKVSGKDISGWYAVDPSCKVCESEKKDINDFQKTDVYRTFMACTEPAAE